MQGIHFIFLVLTIAHIARSALIEDDCREIQCPETKVDCPKDSRQNSTLNDDEDDGSSFSFDDFIHRPIKFSIVRLQTAEPDVIERCCPKPSCICKPCPSGPSCPDNKVGKQIQEEHGQPGSCCPKFECIPEIKCSPYHHQPFAFWRNKCTRCNCYNGQELCDDLCGDRRDEEEASANNCFSEELQSPKMNGDTWTESEGCTQCQCVNGENQCEESSCNVPDCPNPIKISGRCCKVCPATEATTTTTTTTTTPTTTVEVTTAVPSVPEVATDVPADINDDDKSIAHDLWNETKTLILGVSAFFLLLLAIVVICRFGLLRDHVYKQMKRKTKQIYSTVPNSESSQTSPA